MSIHNVQFDNHPLYKDSVTLYCMFLLAISYRLWNICIGNRAVY